MANSYDGDSGTSPEKAAQNEAQHQNSISMLNIGSLRQSTEVPTSKSENNKGCQRKSPHLMPARKFTCTRKDAQCSLPQAISPSDEQEFFSGRRRDSFCKRTNVLPGLRSDGMGHHPDRLLNVVLGAPGGLNARKEIVRESGKRYLVLSERLCRVCKADRCKRRT